MTEKTIEIKRVYDAPAKKDGVRMLVDRLWPRGVSKAGAAIDVWAKALTPSTELRKWYHEDPEGRYAEFKKRYLTELKESKGRLAEIIPHEMRLTLVTSVKDIERSHVPILRDFLLKNL